MDFYFNEDAERLRKEIREFAAERFSLEYIPVHQLEEMLDDYLVMGNKSAEELSKKGWLTISWPKQFGGMEASVWERVAFREEVGYWGILGTGMGESGTGWVGPTLMKMGTEDQKRQHLSLIASGAEDGIWCTGYSEPNAGSDLANLQTSAELQGDEYIINGQKVWTSAAHRSRWCWLACRTNPQTPQKYQGISVLLVDLKSEGVSVRPIKNIIGHKGFNEIFFKNVRVPAANLVGKENEGWYVIMTALYFERTLGLMFSGAIQRALDELIFYAREEGLMDLPVIRHKLADLAVQVRALRLDGYELAWKESEGMDIIYEASMHKLFTAELMERVGCIGSEILGSAAQLDPVTPSDKHSRVRIIIENLYWTAAGLVSGGGTAETLRNTIARFGLKLPRAY